MVLRIALAAAALLPALALAGPEPFRCERQGGGRWREYRSEHFQVATDVSPSDARQLAAQLEQLLALELQALVGEQVELPGRLQVVVFRDPRDYAHYAMPDTAAYYLVGYGRRVLVMQMDGLRIRPELVAHELVHHLSLHLFLRQPRWFAEGIAQFVETVARARTADLPQTGTHIARLGSDAAGGRWVGSVPGDLARAIRSWPLLEVGALLAWRDDAHGAVNEHYLSSWLLYHYLWNKRSRDLSAFQRRLGDGEGYVEAWRASFPEWDPARPESLKSLDDELDRYRRAGRFTAYEVKLPAVEVKLAERDLPSAEVHLVVSNARASWPDAEDARRQLVLAEMEEALQEDPLQPDALAVRSALQRIPARAELQRAAAARPRDARAWYRLAGQLEAPDEREAAYRKAVALDPDDAAPHSDLASLLVRRGRAREALPLANRAVDLAPWDPGYVDTLALVARELGQCPQALQLLRRAVDTAAEDSALRGRLQRDEEETQRRCSAPPAAAPPARPPEPPRLLRRPGT